MLILTKSDLHDFVDEPVEFDALKKAANDGGFQGACKTSSKEWSDFNVHKAFNKTLTTAFIKKYEM